MIDFKKENKELYEPKKDPLIINVPKMIFIAVDGEGNPNTSQSYKEALEILYAIAYTIKMSKMKTEQPLGYQDFVVPPLEGLWWLKGGGLVSDIMNKDAFAWTSMLRLPSFVTPKVFNESKELVHHKKSWLNLNRVRLIEFEEGLCAQITHLGSYDEETPTIARLEKFIIDQGYQIDLSKTRRHHEIYLGDPRKTIPSKLKTLIRYPIK